MTEIINKLNQEIAELERIIQQLKQNLCTYPEGTLQINRSNGSIQYYRRNCRQLSPVETPIRRQYIRKEQQELVRNLAQKDYDQRLLKILENRLKAASKMRDIYMQADPTEVYEKCHSERRKLIIPQFISDEEYAENAIKRIQSMEASGILPGKNLLITAETKQNPISIKSVNILIQEYLI